VQGQAWGGCFIRAAPQALIAGLSYRVFPLLAQPFGWAFCLDFLKTRYSGQLFLFCYIEKVGGRKMNMSEEYVYEKIHDFAEALAKAKNLDESYNILMKQFDDPEMRFVLLKSLQCYFIKKNDQYSACRVEELSFHAEIQIQAQ